MKMSERANWSRWAISLVVSLAIAGGSASCAFRDQVIDLKARMDLLEKITALKLEQIQKSVDRIERFTTPPKAVNP